VGKRRELTSPADHRAVSTTPPHLYFLQNDPRVSGLKVIEPDRESNDSGNNGVHGVSDSAAEEASAQLPFLRLIFEKWRGYAHFKLLVTNLSLYSERLELGPMLQRICLLILLFGGSGAHAQRASDAHDNESHWYVQAGAYVHLDNRDDYEGPPLFGGIEYHRPDNWFGGLSLFNNSFGQFTQYLYLGKQFHPWDAHPNVRVKLTAGVVQGYKDEHYDTLPIRWGGSWGLGFVPTIGYQKGRVGYDVAILGVAGLLFLVGSEF